MLLKILGRVLATIATIIVVAIIRLALFATMFHPYPRAGTASAADQGAGTLAAADHSGWIVFDIANPATGLRTRHARLTAPGPSILELTRSPTEQHATLSLPEPDCAALTRLTASFDKHTAPLEVKPTSDGPVCRLELLDYADIVQSLRDADTLTIHPPKAADITFQVAGLAWD